MTANRLSRVLRSYPSLLGLIAVVASTLSGSAIAQTPLTYENWGQGFITHNCLGCHHSSLKGDFRFGAPENLNFDTLELVREFIDQIYNEATGDNATMPPAGVTWWWDRASLAEWLTAGAPGAADTLHPVVVEKNPVSLSYEGGGIYFSNPIESDYNNRYISFTPDHEDEFEGFLMERAILIRRESSESVLLTGMEWFERTHNWSQTRTRLIEFTPGIPLLMGGPTSNGQTWEQAVSVRERYWDGWWGGTPERDQTRQENWKVTNLGYETIDNGVISPVRALKVRQENLTTNTNHTYWFGKGLGLMRKEIDAPSSSYVRDITREMNIVTEEYPLYGPHIIENASQEWLPFIGRWYSPEWENYDYWYEGERQILALVDDKVELTPTRTATLLIDPTATPVVPTPSHTPFEPGLPPEQPTWTRTPTQIVPTATPTHTEVVTGPSRTPTSTSLIAPTASPTTDINDPHLSDYNEDEKIDVLDLLMFMQHWQAEME